MRVRAHKRQLKTTEWMETNVCVYEQFLFVKLKGNGSCVSTEASAREFFDIN